MSFVLEKHGDSKIKLSGYIDADISDEGLQFLQQMGLDCCYTWIDEKYANFEFLSQLKERTARYGLRLFNVSGYTWSKPEEIHLGLPGRDETIKKFNQFLELLGEVGIPTTTITWEPNHMLCTSPEGETVLPNLFCDSPYSREGIKCSENKEDYYCTTTRGGAKTRLVDMETIDASPLSHGMIVDKEQIWENFTYFIKRVIPTAEQSKVRICLHPNDPPAESCLGIASLIASSSDYERAFEIADSDYFGMEFCCGCWLEGGKEGFGDIYECIKKFIAQEKISIVHLRNITGPLPCFAETFIDDGYANMYKIMKCFVEAGYNGTLLYDHTPMMVPSAGTAGTTAFAVGYIKGVLQAAETELGLRK